MSYEPQPGTIPHKAVRHLRAQPAGAEFTSAQLCDAIDCDTDNFAVLMRRAIQAGAVTVRCKPGHGKLLFWSLGDGKPLPKAEDHEDDEPLPRKSAPQPRPGQLFPPPVSHGCEIPTFSSAGKFPPREPQEFRAALWTDGSLILCGVDVRPDGSVVLPADQMAQVKSLIAWSAPV